ncbi:MAG: FtsX-like permease family protein [Rhodospirillales bacterium]|jgi:cell division transport system permease protein|nr:FtsX-like permease family protein [Rhodospirillales bacterium]MDP7097450.1 FtsX-like permease family protein [Rhodospirillales bacterium]HIJ44420.1 FtsX-like permease family protein [Rhodospirillaceae bacterium]HIJ93799.1 FtsX-like permease family protein [Rhodospirillaceae bacterium]
MLAHRSDLPLDRDAISRFLPWLIAFMVYLACLALAGMLTLGAVAERWDTGISGTLTVQIIPSESSAAAPKEVRRIEAALDILRTTPGIAGAEVIGEDRIMALLEPWLGSIGGSGDLPLPRLIDVELKAGAEVDTAALSKRLRQAVPGTTVDDHGVWLDKLVRLLRAVEILASLVLLLIGSATVGTVVFTTRTGLAIHQEAIEVLHLIGAQDSYVAKQFATRALILGLRGGIIGLVLAVPTLMGIGVLAARMEAGLLPDFTLTPAHWAAMVCLPLVVALIAMLTARLTVMKTLAEML